MISPFAIIKHLTMDRHCLVIVTQFSLRNFDGIIFWVARVVDHFTLINQEVLVITALL
jgi:hypothetical protein